MHRGWPLFTAIFMWAVFLQSVTAGRILRGDDWARSLHRTSAGLLVVAALAAGIVALARLRRHDGGTRLGVILLVLAVSLLVEYGLGTSAADGKDTLWLHIPLGVAVIGFTAQTNMLARKLRAAA